MSEDNILNLEEEPSAAVAPGEAAAEDHPAELAAVGASWEEELTSGLGRFMSDGLSPLRASVASLESALRAVTSQLDEISTATTAGGQLNSQVSGIAAAIKRTIDENSARDTSRFAEQLEAERRVWTDEAEVRMAALRREAEADLESRLSAVRAEVEQEWQSRLKDLDEQLEASREALALTVRSLQSVAPAGTDAPVPGASLQIAESLHLKAAVIEINSQRSQVDTLTALIRNASRFAPRVAFFVVRGGLANGWKASGFNNGLDDDAVKTISLPVDKSSLVGRALLSFETVVATEPGDEVAPVLGHFGVPAPKKALAIPLVVRGRAAAVLYADSGTDQNGSDAQAPLNQAGLEVIMDVGAMGIELLPTRRSEPAPTMPRGTTPLPRKEPDPEPDHEASAPTPAWTAPTPLPVPPVAAVADAPTADRGAVSGETRELPRPSTGLADFSRPIPPSSAEAAVEPAAIAAEGVSGERFPSPTGFAGEINWPEPAASGAEDHPDSQTETDLGATENAETTVQTGGATEAGSDPASSTFDSPVIPPPQPNFEVAPEPTSRVTKPVPDGKPQFNNEREAPPPPPVSVSSSTETEQRAHNDARRFARLLVSEIKLYNGSKVNDGRRNHDLYTRLAEEINRSRKVYEKRVSPAVAARFDYFYDELVQTLAEGDKEKLGGDCPGPILR